MTGKYVRIFVPDEHYAHKEHFSVGHFLIIMERARWRPLWALFLKKSGWTVDFLVGLDAYKFFLTR